MDAEFNEAILNGEPNDFNEFSISSEGLHNAEFFLQCIQRDFELMAHLSKSDPELEEVVRANDISALQQLVQKRHGRCHSRSMIRFNFFLEHFRKKSGPSRFEGLSKSVADFHMKGNPDFGVIYRHSPDVFKRVVMLCIDIKVNEVSLKADVRSGSYSTMISKSSAHACGLLNDLDDSFKSYDDGGRLKILGQVHNSFIKIGNKSYPCPLLVVDSTNIEFVFGFDMLCQLQCIVDLKTKLLKVDDQDVPIDFKEDCPPYLEEYARESSGTATQVPVQLQPQLDNVREDYSAAAASGISSNEFRFSSDGSIVNHEAFVQCIRRDPELRAKLFQIPKLAEVVRGTDMDGLQAVLRRLRCRCHHCMDLLLVQHFDEFKTFDDNRAVAGQRNYSTSVMPYVEMTVGYGFKSKALVDSGAPTTIMSKGLAERCGLLDVLLELNECLESFDDGGRPKILGRIDNSFVKIGESFHHCSLLVLDSPDIEFYFGLDKLCTLKCILDFKHNVLKVGNDEAQIVLMQEEELFWRRPERAKQESISAIDETVNVTDAREAKLQSLMHFMRIKREEAEDALNKSDGDLDGAIQNVLDYFLQTVWKPLSSCM